MRKFLSYLMLLSMMAFLLPGCGFLRDVVGGSGRWPVTVTDRTGEPVAIRTRPERILSMAPSSTEILFALGLGRRVVGRTDWCDFPAEAAAIASVGSEWRPNWELVAGLRPDLVLAVGTAQSAIVVEARRLGLTTVVTQSATLEQVFEDIMLIGRATGAEPAAEQLVAALRGRYQTIRERTRGVRERPSVFWVIDATLWTVGPGTFMDHLTTVAGGVNVAAGAGQAYLQYSMEALLAADPDVIIVAIPREEYPRLQALPGWNQLSAVRNQRVLFPLPALVSRPGPRVLDGLELMARGLHPGLFR
ncbi:MAG TPA: hypothetical protein DCM14_01395 [Clostridiales bacterium UBA8153]|nr:hypothetical protein [Clostridiales bacterium UBA8153]